MSHGLILRFGSISYRNSMVTIMAQSGLFELPVNGTAVMSGQLLIYNWIRFQRGFKVQFADRKYFIVGAYVNSSSDQRFIATHRPNHDVII